MTVHKFFSEMSSYPADCWTGNLTEAFKILKRFEDINYQQFFTLFNTELHRHSLKLHKSRFLSM